MPQPNIIVSFACKIDISRTHMRQRPEMTHEEQGSDISRCLQHLSGWEVFRNTDGSKGSVERRNVFVSVVRRHCEDSNELVRGQVSDFVTAKHVI